MIRTLGRNKYKMLAEHTMQTPTAVILISCSYSFDASANKMPSGNSRIIEVIASFRPRLFIRHKSIPAVNAIPAKVITQIHARGTKT
jgi:hypothetical protein